ncbi:MAG: hypothetical protein RLZZ517_427 [Candidatus Parcubacteria bacterium]|jgi:hypothetical protein
MKKLTLLLEKKLTTSQIVVPLFVFLFMAGTTLSMGILNVQATASVSSAVKQASKAKLSAYGDTTCTSIKHGDITWTFSSAVKCGQFANGEPWVVGPVTVTSISPAPAILPAYVYAGKTYGPFAINGSMKNPVPAQRQGFSQYIQPAAAPVMTDSLNYDAAKNVALQLPNLMLQPNDVLLSSKHGGWPASQGGQQFLESVSALTVLPSVPAEGSFRPYIYGNDRSIKWNINQINWNILKNLDPVSGIKDAAWIYSEMPNLPWIEWTQEWDGWYIMPQKNTADGSLRGNPVGLASVYGKDISYKFGEVGLWLNTNQNIEDKKAIAIRMIQNGLDIYNYLQFPGAGFLEDGGHKAGRKLPLVMAAGMLNDGNQLLESKASNPTLFQEDRQTWFVTQADVGRSIIPEYRGYPTPQTYQQGDVGMAEWGIRHSREPYQDNRNWSTGYRSVVWPAMTGPVLAAELMGLKSLWNHPAIFAYTERFYSINGAPTAMPFLNNMYIKYKLGGTPPDGNPGGGTPSSSGTPTKPSITTPRGSTVPSTNSVTFDWTSDSNTFLIRFATTTEDGALLGTALMQSGYTLKSKTYPVVPGNYYKFWVHAGTDSNYSPQDEVNFQVLDTASRTYNLTAAKTGTGTGSISGIGGAETNFAEGTVVTLTATADEYSVFTGWSGACSGRESCSITMNNNKSVSANFDTTLTPAFTLGDKIKTIRNTNVRASGTLSGRLLGTQDQGNTGTISTNTPVFADGYVWYTVSYDNGASGWSGQDNFEKITSVPTTPISSELSATCLVSDTDVTIGEQTTISLIVNNIPEKYKLTWSGITSSKIKGLNKKSLNQTLTARKSGTIKPKIEIKDAKNSRNKIKITCETISITK